VGGPRGDAFQARAKSLETPTFSGYFYWAQKGREQGGAGGPRRDHGTLEPGFCHGKKGFGNFLRFNFPWGWEKGTGHAAERGLLCFGYVANRLLAGYLKTQGGGFTISGLISFPGGPRSWP